MIKESGIDVRYYSIIYEAIDDVKQMLSGLLAPEVKEQIVGLAEVRDVFRSSKFGTVAGCIVADGYVRRNNPIRVLRNNVVIFEGGLESLRRFKDDVNEVRAGTECGIGVKNYNDVQVGDQIECYSRVEVARSFSDAVSLVPHRRGRVGTHVGPVCRCIVATFRSRSRVMSSKSYPRSSRVAQQIQRALSELIRREVRDPRLGMVTLTEVQVSNDLSYAKVFYSVLVPRREQAQAILDAAADMLRGPLGRALGLRHSPELRFVH